MPNLQSAKIHDTRIMSASRSIQVLDHALAHTQVSLVDSLSWSTDFMCLYESIANISCYINLCI